MANPANSTVQNLLPVQAYFDAQNNFVTFIGQNKPFYAIPDPQQSGLHITNSTIDSTTIGATTPSTAVFVSGQVNTLPVGSTDITNKQYVDSLAAGLSWKQPVAVATTANITLSGLQTIDTYTTLAGDRVLVKSQSNAAQNGIYIASSGAWAYAPDANTWNQYVGAITFVEYGTQKNGAFYCSAQPGGTLGVTALNWASFSVSATYTAGTGLTLTGFSFSITNTGATAGTYGTAARTITQTVNAQGQITNIFDQPIVIANTQVSGLGTMSTQNASSVAITGGTIDGASVGATTASTVRGTTVTATTQFTGPGTGLTGTATSLSIGGNATTATTSTNIAGGAAGSLVYQSASGTTALLEAGTNGQILTLSSGIPAWTNAPATGVTSFSAGTTGLTPSTGTTGAVTLSGTLAVANGGTGVTSSTGSGSNVLNTSPTLVTPVLGVATATSLNIGTLTYTPANALISSQSSVSTYNQIILQNSNTGATASADFIVNNSNSTDSTYYGDFGMNSSGFTGSGAFNQANTVYLTATTADLAIGTTTSNSIHFVINGGTTDAMTINTTGSLALNGSYGTSGQVLTSAGSSAVPTWTTPFAGLTISDDTSTNATRYLTFTSATTGTITTENTSSTKLSFNPSTGLLSFISATMAGTASAYGFKTPNIAEPTTVSATAATGTINYDVTTQSIVYYTSNASANWTVNFRGSSGTSLNTLMATNDTIAVTFMVTQGSTAYYNNALTIDGTSVTAKWAGGTAPTSGNASGIDVYNYVITKTASATYTVLASVTQFK